MKRSRMRIGMLAVGLALGVGGSVQAADSFLVLRASSPLLISGAAGVRLGEADGSLRTTLQAEAGVGGGKLAFGWDDTGEGNYGFGLKVAYLRTWLEPVEVDEDQSFIGLEGEFSIKKLLFNLGGYRRVGDGDDDWLVAAGLGLVL